MKDYLYKVILSLSDSIISLQKSLAVVILIVFETVLLVGHKPLSADVLARQVHDPLGDEAVNVHRVDHEDFTVLVSCLRADNWLDNVAYLVNSSTYSLLMDGLLLFIKGNTIYVDSRHTRLREV